jgi:hypothetical protein
VFPLHAALVRLCWCAIHPQLDLGKMPAGWFRWRRAEITTIPRHGAALEEIEMASARLNALFGGRPEEFCAWLRERTAQQTHPFDTAVREADLEMVQEF